MYVLKPSKRLMKAISIDRLSEGNGKLLAMLAKNSLESFYQTGFEGLCVEAGHSNMSEALISSVIPFDGELLIVGDSEMCKMWRMMCHNLSINVTVIDGSDTENDLNDALRVVMESNRHISHVICSAEREAGNLKLIGDAAKRYRKSLIVDNSCETLSIGDMDLYNIDYLIGADGELSLVLARRSKLVQTEGNARMASHDLYTAWQNSMSLRRPTLEPMAC